MNSKRSPETSSSSDGSDDDDFIGPSLTLVHEITPDIKKRKKRKVIDDSILLDNLPLNEHYGYSYENSSNITCFTSSIDEQIVVAGFKNGTLKLWSKRQINIDNSNEETVDGQLDVIKEFMAHPGKPIVQILFDREGSKFVSIAENDNMINVYDMKLIDMVQSIDIKFIPNTSTCYSNFFFNESNEEKLLISEKNTPNLFIVNLADEEITPITSIHRNPIACVNYNYKYKCFISVDSRGILEIWTPDTNELPKEVEYKYKSETDLFEFVKNKTVPSYICLSKDNELFATFSYPDNLIRVFRFKSGKLIKKFDESISQYEDSVSITLVHREKLLYQNYRDVFSSSRNLVFEKNDKLLIFSSVVGIKILNLQNNKVLKVLGTQDQELMNIRFNQILILNRLNLSQVSGEALASNNRIANSKLIKNPLILATAINSNKLFVFNDNKETGGNLNHMKNRNVKLNVNKNKHNIDNSIKYTKATIHTTLGDIKLNLFPDICPEIVKKFGKLCESKYYNNIIFHRVIKGFMIQTGDPLGDSTDNDSIWDGHFKNEFSSLPQHSKLFMVSMANSELNKNGSLFFTTKESTEWSDDKFSIFGEVISGFETVEAIENLETDDQNKPIDQVSIISTNVHI